MDETRAGLQARSKDELECQKLLLEIQSRQRETRWWYSLLNFKATEFVTATLAIVAVWAGFKSGLFDVKQERLKNESLVLEQKNIAIQREMETLEDTRKTLITSTTELEHEKARIVQETDELRERLRTYEIDDANFQAVRSRQKLNPWKYDFKAIGDRDHLRLTITPHAPVDSGLHLAYGDLLRGWAEIGFFRGGGRLKEIEVYNCHLDPGGFEVTAISGMTALRFHKGSLRRSDLGQIHADHFLDAQQAPGGDIKVELVAVKSNDLKVLDLGDTSDVRWLPLLPNLDELVLTNSQITDTHVETISRAFPNLKYFDLAGTQVTDGCIEFVLRLTKLEEIRFTKTAITEDGILRLLRGLNLKKVFGTDSGVAIHSVVSHKGVEYWVFDRILDDSSRWGLPYDLGN